MATSTTNLGLIKPDGTDKIRIAQINQNMDTLDTKIGAVGNTDLQAQVSANNAAIATLNYSKTLTSSDNLNTIQNGTYNIIATSIPANCPVTNNAIVETWGEGQRFQRVEAATSGMIFVYERRYYNSWGDWCQVANGNVKIAIVTENATTYTFNDVINISLGRYKLFLLVLGDASSIDDMALFIGGVTGNGSAVNMRKISGGSYTLTGSVSNGSLTITANKTCYGGMRLIWLS